MIVFEHICLVFLWMLFCIQHSVFATAWWKQKMFILLGRSFRYYRFFYSFFAFLNLVLLLYFQFAINSPALWKVSGLLQLTSLATGLSGLVIMLSCIRKYFSVVTGIKAFAREKNQVAILQTGGLHKYTRHPLYFGTLVFIWSFFLLFPLVNNLIACGVISVYTLVGIHIEERKLINEFGESYKLYTRRVPRLIPRFPGRRHKLGQSFQETI
ncbi:MAG: isoprenylcysteine carboxylmethyltransferase family protein [Chitinophagaceae bacterium]|nr:isoprenylcysteine carboxylmethyltransferase family protein [Chitinophagaceae bacterium]